MEATIFLEISLILVIATAVAGVAKLLKQPIIIGHIITGLIVGPYVLNVVKSTETIELFSSLGIAFLLFIIGLGLNPKVIKDVGKVATLTGIGQILFTSLVGFGLAFASGFTPATSLFIAVALTFSSTIIVLKLLSDRNELQRLHGKIAVGFLLVQDVVAALALIVVSATGGEAALTTLLTQSLAKGVLLAGGLFLVAHYILPRLSEFFAEAQEFLFLFAVGWGLGIASLAAYLGFSIEIGALLAGVALAATPYSHEISSRMRPLRDFFVVLFFIVLGTRMTFDSVFLNLPPALLFSAFVLVGNPLIVMSIMGFLGYARKTSFKAGLTVAQISEFSLVLILLAAQTGQIDPAVVSMMTLVGLITIAASTYMILYSDRLYEVFEPVLGVFERANVQKQQATDEAYDIVMLGAIKGSHNFFSAFRRMSKNFLVVDYDPEVVEQLKQEDISARFGDISDTEFLDELPLESADLILIALSDYQTTNLAVHHIRQHNSRAVIIAKSEDIEEATELYELGTNYVMMPHYIGTYRVSNIIERHGIDGERFAIEQLRHQRYLRIVKNFGFNHGNLAH